MASQPTHTSLRLGRPLTSDDHVAALGIGATRNDPADVAFPLHSGNAKPRCLPATSKCWPQLSARSPRTSRRSVPIRGVCPLELVSRSFQRPDLPQQASMKWWAVSRQRHRRAVQEGRGMDFETALIGTWADLKRSNSTGPRPGAGASIRDHQGRGVRQIRARPQRRARTILALRSTTAVKLTGHKFLLQRFESRRPNHPVPFSNASYSPPKIARTAWFRRCEPVSVCGIWQWGASPASCPPGLFCFSSVAVALRMEPSLPWISRALLSSMPAACTTLLQRAASSATILAINARIGGGASLPARPYRSVILRSQRVACRAFAHAQYAPVVSPDCACNPIRRRRWRLDTEFRDVDRPAGTPRGLAHDASARSLPDCKRDIAAGSDGVSICTSLAIAATNRRFAPSVGECASTRTSLDTACLNREVEG